MDETPSPLPSPPRPLWFRSLYWRIAFSFAVLVVLVLVGQSAIVSSVLTRRGGEFAPGDPNREATTVAARLLAALSENADASLASDAAFLLVRSSFWAASSCEDSTSCARHDSTVARRSLTLPCSLSMF